MTVDTQRTHRMMNLKQGKTTGLTIALGVLHAAALHAPVPLLNVRRLYLAVCSVQQ
jgi:hypothetical protein